MLFFQRGSTLKGKNLGSKFFPLRVDPFQKILGVLGYKQAITKVVSHCKNLPSVSSPLLNNIQQIELRDKKGLPST